MLGFSPEPDSRREKARVMRGFVREEGVTRSRPWTHVRSGARGHPAAQESGRAEGLGRRRTCRSASGAWG